MPKLHELLAAEKTANGAWHSLYEETKKKFNTPATYFDGHSRSLSMIEDTAANQALEDQERDEKPVVTTVHDTLEWALLVFERAENLQNQKNATNRMATATVLWGGQPFLPELSVHELLGLESRLTKLRELFKDIPTLDASKHWKRNPSLGPHIWEVQFPQEKVKGEKQIQGIELSPATEQHPAQVQAVSKDVPVGKITTVNRSGAVTAAQKADALKRLDELLVEVKQARMRANETVCTDEAIGHLLVSFLMEPFQTEEE
jgi:hypothetical protein